MKIYLCSDWPTLIEKSGVGRAQKHQKMSLDASGIEYTLEPNDDWDIIQINTIFPQSVLQAISSKMKNKPVIYFAHSTQEDFKNSFIGANTFSHLFKKWLKFAYSRADLILTPTNYSKALLESYGLKQPIEVMSNGIDVNYWQADADEIAACRNEYGVSQSDKMIISVGLPIARKGISDFVNLAKVYPEYKFFWFGDINRSMLPHDIKDLIDTAPTNLKFPGYVSRDKLRVIYQACDLYLFTTYEETEGIVLLEALASKTSTIVRDIPVFSAYKDKIDLYKAQDFYEFSSLIPLAVDNVLDDLTENGYQQALSRSIDANGYKYCQIYKNLLEAYNLNQKYKKII